MKQGFITATSLGRYGRFCNGAYIICGILGIAKANNLEPVFPLWINHDHRDRFGSSEDVDLYKHFVHELPRIPEGIQWRDHGVGWGFHRLSFPPGNWNLTGHFQSPRYFDNCMDQVRHYLRMKDEPEQNDYTAIHWRSGDYSTEAGYHPRLTMDYYAPAMERVGGKFLVFSDDIPGAKNLFGSDVEYSEGRDYIQDFKLMKTCRSFIIANSSYSAMAAMVGEHPEKKVIAPRPWFGPVAGITGEDIYDKSWTIINWQDAREAAA